MPVWVAAEVRTTQEQDAPPRHSLSLGWGWETRRELQQSTGPGGRARAVGAADLGPRLRRELRGVRLRVPVRADVRGVRVAVRADLPGGHHPPDGRPRLLHSGNCLVPLPPQEVRVELLQPLLRSTASRAKRKRANQPGKIPPAACGPSAWQRMGGRLGRVEVGGACNTRKPGHGGRRGEKSGRTCISWRHVMSPHFMQITSWVVPCISRTCRTPADWCSRSTFCAPRGEREGGREERAVSTDGPPRHEAAGANAAERGRARGAPVARARGGGRDSPAPG